MCSCLLLILLNYSLILSIIIFRTIPPLNCQDYSLVIYSFCLLTFTFHSSSSRERKVSLQTIKWPKEIMWLAVGFSLRVCIADFNPLLRITARKLLAAYTSLSQFPVSWKKQNLSYFHLVLP